MTEEKEFNLVDEPWIIALDRDGKTEKLSLSNMFKRAHEFVGLAGELPTQNAAILRLLLAVLYAVFTRVDEKGEASPLSKADDALTRWKSLWMPGKFPCKQIDDYLNFYKDRFYLFHPERPFYQVGGLNKGTDYKASKLMGNLSESSNKVRLFQVRTGDAKRALTHAEYDEAARWLLYLNAFDDTSSKPTKSDGQKMPSPGAGWLGKLGLVYAVGENFFETLMLNFSLLDSNGDLWSDDGYAAWERDSVKSAERTEIPMPRSQTELLTLQSRRLLLERNGKDIAGYKLLGGDFFSKENAFSEQMTLWRRDTKSQEELYAPKRHDVSKQLWRDFAALMAKNEGCRPPGVISWLALLEHEGLIPAKALTIQATAVKYGDKDFFVDDIWGDSISVNAAILSSMGENWVNRIADLLAMTDGCVKRLGYLAADLATASGDKSSGKDGKKTAAMEEAYFRLDNPFRIWLSAIDPQSGDIDLSCDAWREQTRGIVMELAKALVEEAGNNAFLGRVIKINNREDIINSPKAYAKFKFSIAKILNK